MKKEENSLTKYILYIFVSILVVWAFDSVNINQIFKKQKVVQATVFYILIVLSIIYLITNFIYDFFLSSNFI